MIIKEHVPEKKPETEKENKIVEEVTQQKTERTQPKIEEKADTKKETELNKPIQSTPAQPEKFVRPEIKNVPQESDWSVIKKGSKKKPK